MRIMGLDVGDKNIGVAVSDALRMTAQGKRTLRRSNLAADLQYLRELAVENEVEQIVKDAVEEALRSASTSEQRMAP